MPRRSSAGAAAAAAAAVAALLCCCVSAVTVAAAAAAAAATTTAAGHNLTTPWYIEPCREVSRACLTSATQRALAGFSEGSAELGVPRLDPYEVRALPIQLPGVRVVVKDARLGGLRGCHIDAVDANLEARTFSLETHCNVTIRGRYQANGRLLLFPINGEGDAKIKITRFHVRLEIESEFPRSNKTGEIHFGIKSYNYTYDYGTRVHYNITNLIQNNPQLSEAVVRFMNENWKLVAEEFGGPVLQYAIGVCIETARAFFAALPYRLLLHVPLPPGVEDAPPL